METSDGRGGECVELGGLLEIVLHLADLDAALSGLRSEEKEGECDHGENLAELEEGARGAIIIEYHLVVIDCGLVVLRTNTEREANVEEKRHIGEKTNLKLDRVAMVQNQFFFLIGR